MLKTSKRRRGKTPGSQRVTASVPAGVIGLGLMGTSIATCLLAAGHPVVGIDLDATKRRSARRRIRALLEEMRREKLLRQRPDAVIRRFTAADDYPALRDAQLVIEAITENVEAKKRVIASVEAVVDPATIIGSNTSAIPITILQKDAARPERVLGTHWAEPAHVTRFMEIICGDRTDAANAERVRDLSRFWAKEASIVRRDIRGFITNRCMYAMLREAFYLVESGYATIEDVDRSLRNDYGYWLTFAGPFRYMDLTGVPAYETVMKDLLPELCNSTEVPRLMHDVVKSGAKGTSNAKGFYPYTPASARRWEKRFLEFTYDIRALALKYPGDSGEKLGRSTSSPRRRHA